MIQVGQLIILTHWLKFNSLATKKLQWESGQVKPLWFKFQSFVSCWSCTHPLLPEPLLFEKDRFHPLPNINLLISIYLVYFNYIFIVCISHSPLIFRTLVITFLAVKCKWLELVKGLGSFSPFLLLISINPWVYFLLLEEEKNERGWNKRSEHSL